MGLSRSLTRLKRNINFALFIRLKYVDLLRCGFMPWVKEVTFRKTIILHTKAANLAVLHVSLRNTGSEST
jgi:hypothetical protein